MATTTRITCIATKYGTKSYGTNGSVYVGRNPDSGSYYRTRVTFPAVRSNAAIGDANIVISKVLLHMRRDSGGPANVTAGCSANSAWGAATDASGGGTIPASTGWHSIDITACAQFMLEYTGNWHMHLTGSGTRVRCNGAGSGSDPYIEIVWEYAASTITTGTETSVLGQPINFAITRQEGEAKYALSYSFGNESGEIGETTGSSITWTPPLEFASELPSAESGEMRVTMRVYDSAGNQLRSEVLFVTVTVPETAVLKFKNDTFDVSTVNGLIYDAYSAALTGKSSFRITPVLDISGAYGASIASLRAEIDNEGSIQTIEWASLTETDAGIFTGDALDTAVLQNPGTADITLIATDTRGREVTAERTFNVYAYANPAISAFSVERYEPVYDANEQVSGYAPSDVGENVWVTLKASCTNVTASGASRNFLAWKITAKAADGTETTYSGSSGTAQSVEITNDRTIITAVVSAANAVDYTVEVSDTAGYKTYQYDSVAPGRANFALAPGKFGASFGCMPKGTQENPMLESAYPFYAYGGIAYKDLLWENPNPGSSFLAQDVYLDLSKYRQIEILFHLPDANSFMWATGVGFNFSMAFEVGSYRAVIVPRIGGTGTGNAVAIFSWRYVNVLEDRIKFDYNWGMTGAGWASMGRDDSCYVPLKIYGIKEIYIGEHQNLVTADGNNFVTSDGYKFMTEVR